MKEGDAVEIEHGLKMKWW